MTGPHLSTAERDPIRYVPILKAREGEFGALQMLRSESPDERRSVLPLLEVPPIPWDFEAGRYQRTLRQHVASLAARLNNAWGKHHPLLLDFSYLGQAETFEDGGLAQSHVLDGAGRLGVRVTPVVSLKSSMAYVEAAGEHAQRYGTGMGLRLKAADFDDEVDLPAHLARIIAGTGGVGPSDTDLVVDLRDLRNDTSRALLEARMVVQSVPSPETWRRVVLAAASFPPDLSEVDAAAPTELPRREWELWEALHRRADRLPPRPLTYGDYTIAHPDVKELDPRTMRMSASVRYTTRDRYLVIKGRNVRQYGYDQYYDLAKAVVRLKDYSGRNFSWGDSYIFECAQEMAGPGNATTWRKVATNHHLALVSAQLSGTLPPPSTPADV